MKNLTLVLVCLLLLIAPSQAAEKQQLSNPNQQAEEAVRSEPTRYAD